MIAIREHLSEAEDEGRGCWGFEGDFVEDGGFDLEGEAVAGAVALGATPEVGLDEDLAAGAGEGLEGIAIAVGAGDAAGERVVAAVAGHDERPGLRHDFLAKRDAVGRLIARIGPFAFLGVFGVGLHVAHQPGIGLAGGFLIDQDAEGAAIGRGDAVEVEACTGELGGEGAIGLFFGLELFFAARGLVAEGLRHAEVGENVAVDDVGAVVALMHGVFEQRGHGQRVRGEIGGPVAAVFDEFDVVPATDLAHGGHVLIGGVFGFAPQGDVALAPVDAGHDDVGGGVAAQFDEQLFQIGRVTDRVSDDEVRLIGDDEMPRPAAQILPRAGIADHLAILDLLRLREALWQLALPELAAAEHIGVARSDGPDEKRAVEALLELLHGQREVLPIGGLRLRHILRRAFRPAFGKHRLVRDETALGGRGRRRVEVKSEKSQQGEAVHPVETAGRRLHFRGTICSRIVIQWFSFQGGGVDFTLRTNSEVVKWDNVLS